MQCLFYDGLCSPLTGRFPAQMRMHTYNILTRDDRNYYIMQKKFFQKNNHHKIHKSKNNPYLCAFKMLKHGNDD